MDDRRPNVTILPEWYPSPSRPVVGTFVREQARAVSPLADVTVVYYDPDARSAGALWSFEEEADDGFRVVRVALRWRRAGPITSALRIAATRAALRRLSRSGRGPDVVHAHVFAAGAVAALAAGWRTPLVVTEHYTGVRLGTLTAWQRLLARLAYRRADLVCPVSADLGDAVARLVPSARIRPVPNSVDTSMFSPPSAGAARGAGPRLLTVALLSRVKAVTNLLQALPEVARRHPDVRLDIAGDGPERAPLEREAADLGIDGRVVFHGLVAKPEVADLMRAADLFVLPSSIENLPCVVIEALASGLPVVATRVGGLAELVPPERGILVPPDDPAALADAIAAALDRLADWDAGELSRAVVDRYGFATTGREWLGVYREVIASR